MTVSVTATTPLSLCRYLPTAQDEGTQSLNYISYEAKYRAPTATHLNAVKDAKAPVTLSDQPHR